MITIRERRSGGKVRLQCDFIAPLGGQGEPRRWRFNCPSHVTSRSAAERWAKDQLARVLRGEAPRTTRPAREKAAAEAEQREQAEQQAAREGMTVRAWLEEYLADLRARRIRETTIATRRRQLRHFIEVAGDRRVADVAELDWQRLRRRLAEHAPSTAAGIMGMAVTALRAAHRVGLRGPVFRPEKIRPSGAIDLEAKQEAYSIAEYARLVAVAGELGERYLAVVLLGGDAGLRVGEIAGLKVEDLDLRRRLLTIRRTIVVLDGQRVEHLPKSGRSRRVPMSPQLLEVLEQLLADPLTGDGWVLHGAHGAPMRPSHVDTALLRVQRRSGMPPRGPHMLRHTFASHALEAGMTLEEVRQLLGHSNIAITARYLHTSPGAVRSAIDRLAEHRTAGTTGTNLVQGPGRRETAPKSDVILRG